MLQETHFFQNDSPHFPSVFSTCGTFTQKSPGLFCFFYGNGMEGVWSVVLSVSVKSAMESRMRDNDVSTHTFCTHLNLEEDLCRTPPSGSTKVSILGEEFYEKQKLVSSVPQQEVKHVKHAMLYFIGLAERSCQTESRAHAVLTLAEVKPQTNFPHAMFGLRRLRWRLWCWCVCVGAEQNTTKWC